MANLYWSDADRVPSYRTPDARVARRIGAEAAVAEKVAVGGGSTVGMLVAVGVAVRVGVAVQVVEGVGVRATSG